MTLLQLRATDIPLPTEVYVPESERQPHALYGIKNPGDTGYIRSLQAVLVAHYDNAHETGDTELIPWHEIPNRSSITADDIVRETCNTAGAIPGATV